MYVYYILYNIQHVLKCGHRMFRYIDLQISRYVYIWPGPVFYGSRDLFPKEKRVPLYWNMVI